MKTLLEQFPYFESSCYTTPEFKSFSIKFKRLFKKAVPADEYVISPGHFYISWFVRRGDKYVYFSIDDVRPKWNWRFLIRTAKGFKDYTGGSNKFTDIDNLSHDIDLLFKYQENV